MGTQLNILQPELRNLIINGNMDFWQRGTSFTGQLANPGAGFTYYADRVSYQGNLATATFTASQSSNVPTLAQSGFASQFSYSMQVTATNTPSSGTFSRHRIYTMEGLDYQNIAGKPCRISFWFMSNITGTWELHIGNTSGTRSYITPFTVSAANVWQKVNIDLVMDTTTSGFAFDNSRSMIIGLNLASGSTFTSGAVQNAWQNGNFLGTTSGPGGTTFFASTSNYFNIAQVALYQVQTGTGTDLPFARTGKTIQSELAMCQRYVYNPYFNAASSGNGIVGTGICFSTTIARVLVPFPVPMRATPTTNWPNATTDFIALQSSGASAAIASVAVDHQTLSNTMLEFDTSLAVLTAGNAAVVRANVASPTLYFDAEL